ncbi:hypothetical protein [Fimbriiglobus ruber]|uniref:Uncharacterized protein n=1 Tax=Fimbriiglobus ruber TaxID=1908690 RepID=A0A225EBL6_9BACT|nr:hypothetical protein [Fimbriiglobus ruber]OWK45767.1 hypothetical protein FRUB_02098 [Fimbriiglobus ruber]
MRFLFELAVFGVIAGVAFAVVFSLTWAVGSPFGLESKRAALFAGVFLCFWLPAFANVHIAVSGSGGESGRERVCAGVRAFGMLVCSAVLTAPLAASGFTWSLGIPLFLAGQVFWWGSCFFEDRFRRGTHAVSTGGAAPDAEQGSVLSRGKNA